jgi:hypothetical protein
MILCDAGVLLCLVDRTQPLHWPYRKAVISLQKPLITTWSCIEELDLLLISLDVVALSKTSSYYQVLKHTLNVINLVFRIVNNFRFSFNFG